MKKELTASQMGKLGAKRKWAKTTKAQRSEHARMMNAKRWKKAKDAV